MIYVCSYISESAYLRVTIWLYRNPNIANETSSESERFLFPLVSFHQEVEKDIHFHLSYFLFSFPPPPPFFSVLLLPFSLLLLQDYLPIPSDWTTTWLTPGLLLVIFKLRWPCLAMSSYERAATWLPAECDIGSKANTLCCRENACVWVWRKGLWNAAAIFPVESQIFKAYSVLELACWNWLSSDVALTANTKN